MLWLFLAIVSSATIALVFKHSETSGLNRFAVTCSNYLTAMIFAGILLLIQGLPESSGEGIGAEFQNVVIAGNDSFSPAASLIWAMIVGCVAGIIFPLGFLAYQISVKEHGVGLAGAFSKMGVLVPLFISLLVWLEIPTPIQWLGIGFALIAITIVNLPRGRKWNEALRLSLILLFLLAGFAEFSHAVFQKYAIRETKNVFLLSTFGVAFLISLAAVLWGARDFGKRDLLVGVAVGIPNFFSSFFLVQALSHVPSSIAYPIFSAGAIVLISLGGYIIFKETLKPIEKASIALTVIAVILINL